MLGGLTYISAELVAPGEVRHASPFARVVMGEFSREVTPRLQQIQAAFQHAGVQTELSDDIARDLWIKFMTITVQAAVTSLTRLGAGPLRDNPPSWQLYLDALREVENVARAKGVGLPAGVAEERHAFILGVPASFKSSMLADVEHNRRLEIEDFSGAIVRLGEQLGVPTPIHRVFYALLSALDHNAQSHPTS
jgi:2-dehydropantoate 2-reductase